MSTRKVSYVISNRRRATDEIPFIRLRGRWLQQLGFHVGTQYTLRHESGNLILTPLP